ncbi:acyl carrier protein [Amycolatopsis rubida]|uniref:Acyl carrier protein n=1 Tax=Amycolatopsis rubida TaxID=112413 RepID=A0A1I5S9E1_9PSEU|nr:MULTISPECIES: phosphopantetheine-binding protein [Amycolatopsis]MYW93117.1 acyl carrier protein [Amycolatopsis rubida]NEC58104.1 acyl carrier protein [Amycolatopsis rubida]OAP22855.1 Acyl carrier protein [Amycolatopsis sp. M39]SFP67333.1 acyl carrier protein [Amycolatopsis rubida]
MTTRTEAEVRSQIREIVLELAPGSPEETSTDPMLVEELEYHSLALLELAFALEDEFDLPPIDEASVQTIKTARDIEDYVLSQLGKAGSGVPAEPAPAE